MVVEALRPYYPENISKPVFIYSTVAYKLTRYKKFIPYMIFATKTHLVLFSFMKEQNKSEKKQRDAVKIFLRQQIVLSDDGDQMLRISVQNQTEDSQILLKMNSDTELKNWIMLMGYGLTPIVRLNIPLMNKLCGSLRSIYDFETVQVDFKPTYRDARYFSMQPFLKHIRTKQQIAQRAVQRIYDWLHNEQQQEPEKDLQIDIKAELNMNIFTYRILKLLQYAGTFELDQGNLQLKEDLLTDDQGRVLRREMLFYEIKQDLEPSEEIRNWTDTFYNLRQCLRDKEMEIQTKNVSVEEVASYLDILHNNLKPKGRDVDESFQATNAQTQRLTSPRVMNQSLNQSTGSFADGMQSVSLAEDEVDMNAFGAFSRQLNDDLYQKLRQNTRQEEVQTGLERGQRPNATESVLYYASQFAQFLGWFKRTAETGAVQLVDEFTLFSEQKRLQDDAVLKQYGHYLKGQYAEQMHKFQDFVARLGETDALEDRMVKLGPVHGSLCYQGVNVQQYQQILDLIQGKQIRLGDKFSAAQGQLLLKAEQQTNGFPQENFEHILTEDAIRQPHFPNQLPPVFETKCANLSFKFCTSQQMHQAIGERRDTDELLFEDELAKKQTEWELQIIEHLYNTPVRHDVETQLTCLVTYYGFSVQVRAVDTVNQKITHGFAKNETGQIVYNYKPSHIPMLEKLGQVLNIQPHLISVCLGNPSLITETILSKAFDAQQIITVLMNGLEKDRLQLIQHFIAEYQGDLIEQLNQVRYQKIYAAADMADTRVFVTSHVSGLVSMCENLMKNFSHLLLADTPREYLELIRRTPEAQRGKLQQQFGMNRLPMKFTSLIEERLNPDASIAAFLEDEAVLKQLEEQMTLHFQGKMQNQNQLLDIQLFLKYLLTKLQAYMNQQALDQAVRWSDYYRLQYLPLLQTNVDLLVSEGQIQLVDVHRVYDYMRVPEYLWLYTANLSQYTELYDVVRLDVVALASAGLLNAALRRLRRSVQQFGMPPMYIYRQSTQNEIEQMVQNNQLTARQLTELQAQAQKLNYFTGDDEERGLMVGQALKLVVVDFLNQLLGFSETSQGFFQELNEYAMIRFAQHAFGEEYSQLIIEQQFNNVQERQVRFKWEPLSRTTLFQERLDAKIEMLQPQMYFERPHAARTYLLNRVCEEVGIVISDKSTWDYSLKKTFFTADIIKLIPVTRMPAISEMEEYGFPYDPLTPQFQEIEKRVNIQFLSAQKHINASHDEVNPMQAAQNSLLLTRRPDTSLLLHRVRAIHFNYCYFGQITNLIRHQPFERLFSDLAQSLAVVTSQMHRSILILQKPNLEQIYAYVEQLEAQQLLSAAALAMVRRNSAEGVAVYQGIERVLSEHSAFMKQLEQGSKEAFIILNKELMSQSNYITQNKKLPQTVEEAFNLAMKSVCSVYSKYSLEAVKLRLKYALMLIKRECFKQALEQLLTCEISVTEQIGRQSRILGEVLNAIGLCYFKQQKFIQAFQYFGKAIDVFWREANQYQIEVEKGQELISQFEQKIALLCGEKQLQHKTGLIALVTKDQVAAVQNPYLQQQKHAVRHALNAKVFLEAKQGLKSVARAINDTARQMQNPEDARIILLQSAKTLKEQLHLKKMDLERTQLIIAQMYQNQASALHRMNEISSNEQQLQQMKQLAIKALQMKAKVLGREHLFTLLSLYQVAELDFMLGDVDASIISIEFLMQRLAAVTTAELREMIEQCSLNPVQIQQELSAFSCFKLLVNCALQQLTGPDLKLLNLIQHQLKLSSAIDIQVANQTLRELLESESVVDTIHEMFKSIRENKDSVCAQRLVNLLQLLNTDYVAIADDIDVEQKTARQGIDFLQLARRAQNIMEDTELMQFQAEQIGAGAIRRVYESRDRDI